MEISDQLLSIIVSIVAGFIYSVWAWFTSKEEFNAKKFALTLGIQVFASIGISYVPVAGDVYSLPFSSTLISVAITKGINRKNKIPPAEVIE